MRQFSNFVQNMTSVSDIINYDIAPENFAQIYKWLVQRISFFSNLCSYPNPNAGHCVGVTLLRKVPRIIIKHLSISLTDYPARCARSLMLHANTWLFCCHWKIFLQFVKIFKCWSRSNNAGQMYRTHEVSLRKLLNKTLIYLQENMFYLQHTVYSFSWKS